MTLWDMPGKGMCVLCKGARRLCGKDRCPILVKYYAKVRYEPLLDSRELEGSSPPGIFVGRYGYPKVYIGPLIPPVKGDTSIMDLPEQWLGKSIDEIVEFRSQLVRGKYATSVHAVEGSGKIVDLTREMAMAKRSADSEALFSKPPRGRIALSEDVQPFGPSARIERLDVSSIRVDQRIEKRYYDTDLKAAPAVVELYNKGIEVSRIQKSFSAGLFGLGSNRKFVPTRWSITAVDSTISEFLMEKTRQAPLISDYLVYETIGLDNRWIIIMMPRPWAYELIEAWYPGTVWNPLGKEIEIFSSSEFYEGRTTYAEIGGCYYAARLAVNELLNGMRRQAGVVILREACPGYIMPVGVWNVREHVRDALKKEPTRYQNLKEVFAHVSKKLEISLNTWLENSDVLRDTLFQKRITDY